MASERRGHSTAHDEGTPTFYFDRKSHDVDGMSRGGSSNWGGSSGTAASPTSADPGQHRGGGGSSLASQAYQTLSFLGAVVIKSSALVSTNCYRWFPAEAPRKDM